MKVIYQGVSEETQAKVLAAHMASIDPPEKTAQEPYYHIQDRDGAMTVEKKKKRTAEWMAEREVERKAELADLDKLKILDGIRFPKGETVEIPDDHKLVTNHIILDGIKKQVQGRMFVLLEAGLFKLAEPDEEVADLPTESEATSEIVKKRPGRPRKG